MLRFRVQSGTISLMSQKIVTAPERIELLLPWLNRDEDDPGDAIGRFLDEFVAARQTETLGYDGRTAALTKRQANQLRRELRHILDLAEHVDLGYPWHSQSALKFTVLRQRDRPDRMPKAAAERQAVEGSGAFRLQVHGPLPDIVLYAFVQTLLEPGMVQLARCMAPAPGDWSETCGRYLVTGKRPGRPRIYCSRACRVRAWREKESPYGGKS